jgi:hypothetical protein
MKESGMKDKDGRLNVRRWKEKTRDEHNNRNHNEGSMTTTTTPRSTVAVKACCAHVPSGSVTYCPTAMDAWRDVNDMNNRID